jgi:hypothetical protein
MATGSPNRDSRPAFGGWDCCRRASSLVSSVLVGILPALRDRFISFLIFNLFNSKITAFVLWPPLRQTFVLHKIIYKNIIRL